jgi:hypothetical protein
VISVTATDQEIRKGGLANGRGGLDHGGHGQEPRDIGHGHGGYGHGGHSHDTPKNKNKKLHMNKQKKLYMGTIHTVHMPDLCCALLSLSPSSVTLLTAWCPGHRLWGTGLCAR